MLYVSLYYSTQTFSYGVVHTKNGTLLNPLARFTPSFNNLPSQVFLNNSFKEAKTSFQTYFSNSFSLEQNLLTTSK